MKTKAILMVLLVCSLFLISGCGKKSAPEEKQAEAPNPQEDAREAAEEEAEIEGMSEPDVEEYDVELGEII